MPPDSVPFWLRGVRVDSQLAALLSAWSEDLKLGRSRSKNTLIAYEGDLHAFLVFLQAYDGADLTLERLFSLQPREWRAWLTDQRAHGLTAMTLTRRLSALKSLFRFFLRSGLLEAHPILSARHPRILKGLPRPATLPEIQQMADVLASAAADVWVQKRDLALLTLLYGAGLRIQEALSLNGSDWGEEHLTVQGKGGKHRQVPLLPLVIQRINDYRQLCPHDLSGANPLFVGVKGRRLLAQVFEAKVRRSRRALGLAETLTPHALRHSCASHLLAASGDLRGIQELLGHASLSTTQVYTGLEDEQLREAVDKAHPAARRKEV